MRYVFRRESDGKLLKLPFSYVLKQDAAGYVTLPNGQVARRAWHEEAVYHSKLNKSAKKRGRKRALNQDTSYLNSQPAIISDSLGFPAFQLPQMLEDLRRSGCTGIEFIQDKTCPYFYQVKCNSEAARNAYAKHRGFFVKTGIGGVKITKEELERAANRVKEIYG